MLTLRQNLLPDTTASAFPQIHCKPQIILRPLQTGCWPPPAGLCDLHSAHHDRLGQAGLCRADGAQGSSEQPSLSGGERGRGQGQAVQLCVGAFPERPVDQRPLPLKSLLLTGLCGEREGGRGELWSQTEANRCSLSNACWNHWNATASWSLCYGFVIFIFLCSRGLWIVQQLASKSLTVGFIHTHMNARCVHTDTEGRCYRERQF